MNPAVHSEFHAEIQAEIQQLESYLERLRLIAEFHREKAGSATTNGSADQAPSPVDDLKIITHRPARFANLMQVKAAEMALSEIGRPATAAEIVEQMISGGFPETDRSKLRNAIFTGMTRKPSVFKKVGRGLWDLVVRHANNSVE